MFSTSLRNVSLVATVALLTLSPAVAMQPAEGQATVQFSPAALEFSDIGSVERSVVSVSGPNDVYFRLSFSGDELPNIPLYDQNGQPLPDGQYAWELATSPRLSSGARAALQASRNQLKVGSLGSPAAGGRTFTGYFRVLRGQFVSSEASEESRGQGGALEKASDQDQPTRDQQILDDLIVDGSICVGQDCNNGESFGFDTIRLKENNLRIRAQDTSNSASFPTRDWQITFNDSSNGGANKFSIDDIDGARTPFTIEAGAPSHSLYVEDGGRVGIGTSTPVVDLHVKTGNSPTLRLEQDGTSGFTPQTWDVAGNEANFFIRDATNGSTLPFRIFPDAPSNAIAIEASGDVGLGTTSPGASLDILRSGDRVTLKMGVASGDSWQIVMDDDESSNPGLSFTKSGTGTREFRIAPDGEVFINAVSAHVPDYVFEPDYDLMSVEDLAEYVRTEKHLPSIPSADEIEKNGLPMREFQLQLLKKIEELTLYTIDLNQEVKDLRSQLDELEKE